MAAGAGLRLCDRLAEGHAQGPAVWPPAENWLATTFRDRYVNVDHQGRLQSITMYSDPNERVALELQGQVLAGPGSTLALGLAFYMLPQDPLFAARLYAAFVKTVGVRSHPKRLANLGVQSLALLLVLAVELDDEELATQVAPHARRKGQGKRFGPNLDEFGWFCFLGEPWPRGQISALLMVADVLSPGDWQRAFHDAGDGSRFSAPTVEDVDFPLVGLKRAFNDGPELIVDTFTATSSEAGNPTSFTITNLPDAHALTASCDGEPFHSFSVVSPHTVRVSTTIAEHLFVFRTDHQEPLHHSAFLPVSIRDVRAVMELEGVMGALRLGSEAQQVEMAEDVAAFLEELQPVPTTDDLPSELRSLGAAVRKVYATEPDKRMDLGGHAFGVRTFLGSLGSVLSSVKAANRREKRATVQLVGFLLRVMQATSAVSVHADSDFLNSLRHAEMALGFAWKRLRLGDTGAEAGDTWDLLRNLISVEKDKAKQRDSDDADLRAVAVLEVPRGLVPGLSKGVAQLVQDLEPAAEDLDARDAVVRDACEILRSADVMTDVLAVLKESREVVGVAGDPVAAALAGEEWLAAHSFRLELFGSSASGLNFRKSADVDLSLLGVADFVRCVTKAHDGEDHVNEQELTATERPDSVAVKVLAEHLERSTVFQVEEVIMTSRVPLIKVNHVQTGVACDIASGNSVALVNTELLRLYATLEPRARALLYAVKFWAKARAICDASQGTLSSYAWTLLVIFFLQQDRVSNVPLNEAKASAERGKGKQRRGKKAKASLGEVAHSAVLLSLQALAKEKGHPAEELTLSQGSFDVSFTKGLPDTFDPSPDEVGQLLADFFLFYGFQFDIRRTVVSVRLGKPAQRRDLENAYTQCDWRLAIEDPFELSHDLGSKISSKEAMRHILAELRAMRVELQTSSSESLASRLGHPAGLPPHHGQFPRRCFICGSPKHRASKCALGFVKDMDLKLCHACGQSGHPVRKCPKLEEKRRRKVGTQRT
ncbi:Terminal uridylyltransferase 7 (TUTase 7) (Zinc finger CCHC domain-containing protein 6) [Durusdinium trenchii]|uniref:Terminal uridylyltransferase 7 (TUTase 7) (Zinc finger CCHC domain-containing protein 6) n=1 Tax=Durusdinium trenchii TaxID=1381693 RepID=A0ABP0J5G3_9DINO